MEAGGLESLRAVEADGLESSVRVELRGLSLHTHHGVTDAEQAVGQRLLIDVQLELSRCDALLSDRIEETIDYAAVCELVATTATERSYRTLERLCRVIGERLLQHHGCDRVHVRAAKPEPPLPFAVDEAAVELVVERAGGDSGPGGPEEASG